jgi:hypothetical protein
MRRCQEEQTMRITTPTQIESEHVAWEGYLEPLSETLKGGVPRPRVTLGKPTWWPAEQAVKGETGKEWTPPAGDRRYTLLRLACTLHPPGEPRARYTGATLNTYLRPRYGAGSVVAHDLHPQRLSADQQATYTLGLGPDLKFAQLFEASMFELGGEIEVRKVFPVVQGYGLGESNPYWQFAHHPAHPLQGCQCVYAVLDAPGEAGGVRLSISLVATMETRFGPVRLGVPQEVRAYVGGTVEA